MSAGEQVSSMEHLSESIAHLSVFTPFDSLCCLAVQFQASYAWARLNDAVRHIQFDEYSHKLQ